MQSKDPRDVVHELGALEAYMDAYLHSEDITFEQWVPRFAGGFYLERNGIMADFVLPLRPRHVLEFACAGPYLAELMLQRAPSIVAYLCTNFSARMVEFCRDVVHDTPRFRAALVDADVHRSTDMHRGSISGHDVFLTTSLEHIQFDRELVAELPIGSRFVFSVAKFDDPEHFRVFDSVRDVAARYDGLIRVTNSRETVDGLKLVVVSVREDSA